LRFALATGKSLPSVFFPQAVSLSGFAAFGNNVYASASAAGTVYRIEGDRGVEEARLKGVSGLTVVEGCLYTVSMTERDIYVIDPRENWLPKPFGLAAQFRAPARIEMLAEGSFIVSDGEGGKLACVSPDWKTVRKVAELPGADDMALDWNRKRLIVPVAKENHVRVYALRLDDSPGITGDMR